MEKQWALMLAILAVSALVVAFLASLSLWLGTGADVLVIAYAIYDNVQERKKR